MRFESDPGDPVAELRHWVTTTATEALTVREWWCALHDAGWAFPSWPRRLGGREDPASTARAIERALVELDVVLPPRGLAVTMLAPTVLRHGSAEQADRFLHRIARGELSACQLFSEPEAGSDLAGLRTRARLEGDRWIVDGQKVWSSGADGADVGMLLARTDATAPKRRGITYFVIPMDQPGVEVRPLRQMNGLSGFNEVFLDDAVVLDVDRIGEPGRGWEVARTTLAHERSATPPSGRTIPAGERAGWLDRRLDEARSEVDPASHQPRLYSRSGRAAARLARSLGRSHDAVTRQRVADLHIRSEINKLTAGRFRAGRVPGGPQVVKLQAAELARRARDLDLAILGPIGVASDGDRFRDVALMALSAHVVSIGGGTDEIQRNVLAEQVLDLPREPDPPHDRPHDRPPAR